MAITDDKDRPKRNDLPARAAKRIVKEWFEGIRIKAKDAKYDPQAELATKIMMNEIEDRIARAIWDEMLVLEGEMALGKRGLPE